MLPVAFLGDAFLADTFSPAMRHSGISVVIAEMTTYRHATHHEFYCHLLQSINDTSKAQLPGKSAGVWQQRRVRGRVATITCLLLGSLCRPLLPRLGCCLLRSPHFLGLGPLGR